MLKRFFALLKSLIAAEPKRLDDPERLLKQAEAEMRQKQIDNRERAVQAVTARNHLQQQLNDMWSRIDKLTDKITEAERRGDSEEAQNLRQKRDDYVETLAKMDEQLARATEISEQVKDAIRREEEKVRQKTRDALELKAQWRDAQNANELERLTSLLQLKAQWRNDLDENDNDPLQNDSVIMWVLALIGLCLLGLLILRIVG